MQWWTEALRNPRILKIVRKSVDEPRRMLAAIVTRARDNDEMPKNIDPDAMARVLIALFQGFALQLAWDPRIDPKPVGPRPNSSACWRTCSAGTAVGPSRRFSVATCGRCATQGPMRRAPRTPSFACSSFSSTSRSRKNGLRRTPPAGIAMLKVGEWRAWTDEEYKQFEARWAPGTKERRAYVFSLYRGQRLTDLVATARIARTEHSGRAEQDRRGTLDPRTP